MEEAYFFVKQGDLDFYPRGWNRRIYVAPEYVRVKSKKKVELGHEHLAFSCIKS